MHTMEDGVLRTPRKALALFVGLVVAVAGFLVVGTVASTDASGAPVPSSVVDDRTTSGTNRFAFTGTWVNCGGCNTGAYQNSFQYSNTTGSKVTLTFTGTQATLYGYKEIWGGIAAVSVDGGQPVDVDLYSPTQTLTGLFATPVLAQGTHTVSMTVTGRSSGSSRTINIDKADIFTADAVTPTPTPTATVTPTPTPTTHTPTPTTPTPTVTETETDAPPPTTSSGPPSTPTTSTPTPTPTTPTPTVTATETETDAPPPTTSSSPPSSTPTTSPTVTTTPTVTTSPPVTSSPAPPNTPPTAVDDRTTSGTNRWSYTGTWVNCGGCNSGAYQNSFKYSNTTGSTATLTFTGTQATLHGYKEKWGGIASITVDGGDPVEIDLYSANQFLTTLYTSPALPHGTHTVTMAVTGRSSSGSTTINIDKADVYTGTGPTVPPTTTTSTAQPTTAPPTTAPPTTAPPTTDPTTPSAPPTTTSSTPAPSGPGMVSLSFDDSQAGHYANVRPILAAAGMKATFYVISDSFGWGSGHLTPAQAKTLADEGHELGNHTRDHPDLTKLSEAAIEAEFADAQNAIRSATGVTPTTCAYPMGLSNSTVRTVAARHFAACRGTLGGQNTPGSLATYNLVTLYVQTSTSAADVRAAVEKAKTDNTWLILCYHGVGTVGSSDDVTPAVLQSHVDAIKQSGITVKPVAGALSSLGG